MNCFKVVKDNEVIDIGSVLLRWNERYNQMFITDVAKAQFAQSHDKEKLYHADWMREFPKSLGEYDYSQVILINREEYDELKALLDNGEKVEYLPTPQEDLQEDRSIEPEKPMSIAEMREQIEMLTECVLEMSQMLYGE